MIEQRPVLDKNLDSKIFQEFYYTKNELLDFCRENHLPTSGGKADLTERIALYLDTGHISANDVSCKRKSHNTPYQFITTSTLIEDNIVCSEMHRAFFKEHIGKQFSFFVAFQKWLKANSGKTYGEAITAYYQLLDEKKNGHSSIGKQFEYNTYIRDFFKNNKNLSLQDAIICWNKKKSLPGHNRYEESDLSALEKQPDTVISTQ